MKILTPISVISAMLLIALLVFNLWFFSTYTSYKTTEIERLTSSPLDDEVASDTFGTTPDSLIKYFQGQNDYVFQYEMFMVKLRLESDGSVYFNDQLLYTDKQKVVDFLSKYAAKGIFNTSVQTLYFRDYLKNRKLNDLNTVPVGDTNTHIMLQFGNQVVFDESFYLSISQLDYSEAKAVVEMWDELRHFGKAGQELWGLLE
jgi:hypothetical protein